MPSYVTLTLAGLVALMAIGCRDRGADDRIALNEDLRQANHGPGYTVVALRTVDRARLSNSGVVIINESGLQPVYVSDIAYTRQSAAETRDAIRDLDALNERLMNLQEGLDRAARPPAPAPAPESVSAAAAPAPAVVAPAPAVEATTPAEPPPAAVEPMPAIDVEPIESPTPAKTSVRSTPANAGRGQFRRQVVDRNGNPITDLNGNPITSGTAP